MDVTLPAIGACSIREKDYFSLLKHAVANNAGYDAGECTLLYFQVFHDVVESKDDPAVFHKNLAFAKRLLRYLYGKTKFDHFKFKELLRRTFPSLPFELTWWLHDNDVMPLAENLKNLSSQEIVRMIQDKSANQKRDRVFDDNVIVRDLLNVVISGAFVMKSNICKLKSAVDWHNHCNNIVKDFVNVCIDAMRNDKPVHLLANKTFSVNTGAFSSTYKLFFYHMLKELMTSEIDFCDIYSAYTFQYLFTSKQTRHSHKTVFGLIFRYVDVKFVFNIMDLYSSRINYKYTLFALSCWIRENSDCEKKLQDTIVRFLDGTFKGGKIMELVKALLVARHLALESENKSRYQQWYSKMFGTNAIYKTSTAVSVFRYFTQCLTKLLPYEPKFALKVHLSCSLRAPPGCNSLIFDYKNLGNLSMDELHSSPSVKLEGVRVPVTHLIEECNRRNEITCTTKFLIRNNPADYKRKFLPQLLTTGEKYGSVKNLLIRNRYLTDEVAQNVPSIDASLSDSDSDDFE